MLAKGTSLMAWTGEVSLPMCGATKCGPYKRFGTQTWCFGKYYLLGWKALPQLPPFTPGLVTLGLDTPKHLVFLRF